MLEQELSHLDAILGRIMRERQRLAAARTERDRAFRRREIVAAEKELASEYRFLGIDPVPDTGSIMLSDDELLSELMEQPQ